MHARTGSSQMKPGKMDEAIGMYRESVLPTLKAQKGFKGLYWLTDRSTDKYTVITLRESEADMKATETSGLLQEVIAKFGAFVATPPVIQHDEVSFHARGARQPVFESRAGRCNGRLCRPLDDLMGKTAARAEGWTRTGFLRAA